MTAVKLFAMTALAVNAVLYAYMGFPVTVYMGWFVAMVGTSFIKVD
jgi:hypothetical protein